MVDEAENVDLGGNVPAEEPVNSQSPQSSQSLPTPGQGSETPVESTSVPPAEPAGLGVPEMAPEATPETIEESRESAAALPVKDRASLEVVETGEKSTSETGLPSGPLAVPEMLKNTEAENIKAESTVVPALGATGTNSSGSSVQTETKQKEQTAPPSAFDRFKENARNIRQLAILGRAAIQTKRRKNLEKIMTIFAKKQKITNDEVERLLHVSNHTAANYLSILMKEGRIRREGKSSATRYVKSL